MDCNKFWKFFFSFSPPATQAPIFWKFYTFECYGLKKKSQDCLNSCVKFTEEGNQGAKGKDQFAQAGTADVTLS